MEGDLQDAPKIQDLFDQMVIIYERHRLPVNEELCLVCGDDALWMCVGLEELCARSREFHYEPSKQHANDAGGSFRESHLQPGIDRFDRPLLTSSLHRNS